MKVIIENIVDGLCTTTKNIPVGFFMGSIGAYSGLFFRSAYDVTYLGPKPSFTGRVNWGYGIDDSGCEVTKYRPVDVKIAVFESIKEEK